MDWIEKIAKPILAAAATVVAGYLAIAADVFCGVLDVNKIYCDTPIIKFEVFTLLGAVAAILFGAYWRLLGLIAIVATAVVVVRAWYVDLRTATQNDIVFQYIVPLQIAAGIVLGLLLRFLWVKFSPIVIQWLQTMLKKMQQKKSR
jgi:hypothetical protein